jgi:hypothetical protein
MVGEVGEKGFASEDHWKPRKETERETSPGGREEKRVETSLSDTPQITCEAPCPMVLTRVCPVVLRSAFRSCLLITTWMPIHSLILPRGSLLALATDLPPDTPPLFSFPGALLAVVIDGEAGPLNLATRFLPTMNPMPSSSSLTSLVLKHLPDISCSFSTWRIPASSSSSPGTCPLPGGASAARPAAPIAQISSESPGCLLSVCC